MRRILAAASLSLLAACEGPLLFLEIEIPEARVTLPSQSFPASDTSDTADWCDPSAPSNPLPSCVARTLDYDLGAEIPTLVEPGVTYDVRLTDVAITLSATETGDMGGIVSAVVRVLDDPADPSAGTVVASYTRSGTASPRSIAVSGNSSVDLGPFLNGGRLPIRVEIVFDNLTPAFLADVEAGFSLVLKVDWGSYL